MWIAGERRRAFLLRAAGFCFGVLAGAVAFGAAIGFAAGRLGGASRATAGIVLLVAAASVLHEALGRSFRLPDLRWQVPRDWMRSFWTGALAFGVIMGAGVFTRTLSMTFYLYLLLCAFSGSAAWAAAIASAYGATYVAGFVYGSVAWRRLEAGGHADAMDRVAQRLRPVAVVGALAAAVTAGITLG